MHRMKPTKEAGVMSVLQGYDAHAGYHATRFGERAWPLLEWLVRIWEKEERVMEENGRGRWSPSLFTQIKPARSGVGARTDVDRPLAVIFECYKSNNLRRQRLGSRLLSLVRVYDLYYRVTHL